MTARAELVIRGQIVLAAEPAGLVTTEAIGIAGDRVVSAGRADDVLGAAMAGAEIIDARESAVIPGLHDFHIHLVGLARVRDRIVLERRLPHSSPRLRHRGSTPAVHHHVDQRGGSQIRHAGKALPLVSGQQLPRRVRVGAPA